MRRKEDQGTGPWIVGAIEALTGSTGAVNLRDAALKGGPSGRSRPAVYGSGTHQVLSDGALAENSDFCELGYSDGSVRANEHRIPAGSAIL